MRVVFTVTAGPHQGKTFAFEGHDTFVVGRSKRAHFRLPEKDEYFSRIHFLVEVNPPQCRLIDMGSTNGTYVNGQKTAVTDLNDGDLIQGGQTVLRVVVEGDDSEEATRLYTPAATSPTPSAITPRIVPSGAVPPAQTPTPWQAETVQAVPCSACSAPTSGLFGAGMRLCKTCHDQISACPQPIPGYRIVRKLGEGGMGVVYLALRDSDGTAMALKTILPKGDVTPANVDRFLREANILSQLIHPYIIAFRDLGEVNGVIWFAMDYVRGSDAARLLKEKGPLSIRQAVEWTCQLLEALEYAHGRGFVHRDVKPHNLMVTDEGAVKLVDFGLARVYQASRLSGLSIMGQVGGTLAFMAPEQITSFREARPPVDQYAAGATLYNLLTGRHIFDLPQKLQDKLLKILQDKPVPIRERRPDVPEELAAIIHRSLSREPEARFAGVGEMLKELERFAGGYVTKG